MTQDSLDSSGCVTDADLRDVLAQVNGTDVAREHLDSCSKCQRRMELILASDEIERTSLLPSRDAEVQPWMLDILHTVAKSPPSLPPEDIRETGGRRDGTSMVFPQTSADPHAFGRLDEFEIQMHVASGGMGHLFRAFDTRLQRIVAIKVLRAELCSSEQARRRFLQEANAIARASSDHIVAVYDARERADFPPFIVMEFVDGRSLQQRLNDGEHLEFRQSVEFICQALSGLSAAHKMGVIHRDIKPGNILIQRPQNRVKLVDFGLPRLEEQDLDSTSPGILAGTPTYMAPEQILDAHSANTASDVYSTGVLLYRLLTGEPPFRGSERMILQQVLHEDPRPLRSFDDQVPRDLQTICLKAMSKVPIQRFPTAALFREDLERWLNGKPVLSRPVGLFGRLIRWNARNPVIAKLTLVILTLLLVLSITWVRFTILTTQARNKLQLGNDELHRSNQLLKKSNLRADAEKQSALQQANNANQQANLSFRVLNRLTFELQDALADRPELQQRLLHATTEDLRQLSATMTSDSPVRVTLAVALLRLGEASLASGNVTAAGECFDLVQETLETTSKELYGEPDVLQCRAWLSLNLGSLAYHRQGCRSVPPISECGRCLPVHRGH